MFQRKHVQRRLPIGAIVAVVALGTLAGCSGGVEPSSPGATDATTSGAAAPGDGAANALYFYPPVEGATLNYTNSGFDSSTTEVTVDSVTSGPDGQTVVVTEVISASMGEPVTVERTLHTGPDGSLSINAGAFGAFGSGFSVTAEGEDIVIPPIADLESGEVASGETFVEVAGPGLTMRNEMAYEVTGVGSESVTVPLGTVQAYVIDVELDITSSVAGATTGSGRYWFVPGFGLVKQEFTILALTGTTELTASSVPLP